MKNLVTCFLASAVAVVMLPQLAMADGSGSIQFQAPVQVLCSRTKPLKEQLKCQVIKTQAEIDASNESIQQISQVIDSKHAKLQTEQHMTKLIPAGALSVVAGVAAIVLVVRNAPETLVGRYLVGLFGSAAAAAGGAMVHDGVHAVWYSIPKTKKNIALLQQLVDQQKQELAAEQAQLKYLKYMLNSTGNY